MRFSIHFILLFFLVIPQAYAEVRVVAQVDSSQASLEDEIVLTVRVEGSARASDPVLPRMPNFKVVSSGSSSSIQILNGHIATEKNYSFVLLPQEEGAYTIEPITVFVDGREYKSDPVTVYIKATGTNTPPPIVGSPYPPGQMPPTLPPDKSNPPPSTPSTGTETRDYWIATEVSNPTPYVNEQILYVFRFYTRLKVGDAVLSLPDFTQFWVEEVVPEKKFYQEIGGDRFVISEKVLAIFPLQPGKFSIDDAKLKLEVPDMSQHSLFNDPFFSFSTVKTKTKNLKSGKIDIEVKPLPEPAPQNYTNLVGSFAMGVSLEPQQLKVGDSATLTVTLKGKGNVKDAILPLAKDWEGFKVYDDNPEAETVRSETGVEGSKVFKRALVPQKAGDLAIPNLDLTYFDPSTGRYESLTAPALALQVSPNASETQVAVTGTDLNQPDTPVALTEEIATIHTEWDAEEKSGSGKVWFATALVSFLAYVLLRLAQFIRARRAADSEGLRKRGALKRFKKSVGMARSLKGSSGQDALLDAAREYFGDKFLIFGKGLTTRDIVERLREKKLDAALVNEMEAHLSVLEQSLYSGSAASRPNADLAEEGLRLIRKVDSHL